MISIAQGAVRFRVTTAAAPVVVPPPASTVQYGWDEAYDAGTNADLIVNAAGGDDFTTISDAVAAAVASGSPKTIAVKAGTYREQFSTSGFEGTIKGYGTDKPKIVGSEPLTGFVPCTSGDAALVGPNWSSIWKRTGLASSAYASSTPAGLNLYEGDDKPLLIATDRADTSDIFYSADNTAFHIADSLGLNGSNQVLSITDASVISNYTEAQLLNAYVNLHHQPNLVSPVNITGKSGNTIMVDGLRTVQGGTATPGSTQRYFSLLNILPAMRRGGWGYSDEGGGKVTVYVWPNDPADIDKIEYSARSRIIDYTSSTAGEVTLEGVQLLRPAGNSSSYDGVCFGTYSGAATKKSYGVTMRHCRLGQNANPLKGYGMVWLSSTDNVLIEYCDFVQTPDCYGLTVLGTLGTQATDKSYPNANQCDNHIYRNNRFFEIGSSPYRSLAVSNIQWTYNYHEKCSQGAHANRLSFYDQCFNILVYGNRFVECGGYLTWQEATKVFIGFNDIPVSSLIIPNNQGRAIADQNYSGTGSGTFPPPSSGDKCILWNNLVPPNPLQLTDTNSVALGKSGTPPYRVIYDLLNSVIHGGGITHPTPDGVEGTREGNLYTARAQWQEVSDPWAANASELITDLASTYVDAAAGDFSPKPGGPLATRTGHDLTDTIAYVQAFFPDFDFTKDINGNLISVTVPPVGPRGL